MGGKGSGRRPGRSKAVENESVENEVIQEGAETTPPPVRRKKGKVTPTPVDPDVNHRSIQLGNALMELGDIEDWGDTKVLRERFKRCVELCDEWGFPPSMSNFALGFGVSTNLLGELCSGARQRYKGLTSKSVNFLKKIYDFSKQNLENNLLAERGNPVKWIFMGKNYFGLTDQVEKVIKHVDEKPDLPQSSKVVDKYANLVGQEQPKLMEAEIIEVETIEPGQEHV